MFITLIAYSDVKCLISKKNLFNDVDGMNGFFINVEKFRKFLGVVWIFNEEFIEIFLMGEIFGLSIILVEFF